MQRSVGIICLSVLLLLLFAQQTWAQEEENNEPDTVIIVQDTLVNDQEMIGIPLGDETEKTTFGSRNTKKIPRKAALYAAALPGLGQVYNGGYWKVPIVYGTFITLGWFANFNTDRYLLFRRANIALESGLLDENPLQGTVVTNISSNLEATRRSRDFTYILMAGAYALQIMEAIVDAHLIEFDVNEDLSMQFQPSMGQYFASATGPGSFVPAMGASFILKIK